MLKKVSIRMGFVVFMLGSVVSMADNMQLELQKQIDKIELIDESNNSMDSNRTIVGCDDKSDPVEKQNCYKESATAILTKLSASEELTKADDIKDIKAQLSAILMQLAKLEKQQSEIITKNKKSKTNEEVKKNTTNNKITPKEIAEPKKIKILEEGDEYTKIEVQKGENLSLYAKEFYGNSRKYNVIYKANREIISENLQIAEGDILRIPTVAFLEKSKLEVIENREEPIEEEIVVKEKQKESIAEIVTNKEKKVEVVEKIEEVEVAIVKKVEDKKIVAEKVAIEKVVTEKAIIEKVKIEVVQKVKSSESESESEIEVLDEVIIEDESSNSKDTNKEKEHIPFIETRVKKGADIYEIAQKYYGDSKEYHHIQSANRDKIGKDLKIKNDMSIKIPMTKLFEEQPEFLNIQ